MNEAILINRKLASLSSEQRYVDGAQVLSVGSTDTNLAAVLQVIDDTMLPRKLVFAAGEAKVACVAAGRRLTSLVETSGNLQLAPGLQGKILSRDDGAALDHMASLFQSLLKTGQALTVTRSQAKGQDGQSDKGINASGLAQAWGVDLDAEPLSPAMMFLSELSDKVSGGLLIEDGDVIETVGKIKGLKTAMNAEWPKVAGKHPNSKLLCLPGILADGQLMVQAEIQDATAMLDAPENALADIYTAWSRISGRA